MSDVLVEVDQRVRAQRLSLGKCPDHGTILIFKEMMVEADVNVGRVYCCPQSPCGYSVEARMGTRMDKLLHR